MISTSNTSGPRAARAATSFWGVAQPEPMNTRSPLRRHTRAFSAVVQRDELSFWIACPTMSKKELASANQRGLELQVQT
jgi:hypothetical protein